MVLINDTRYTRFKTLLLHAAGNFIIGIIVYNNQFKSITEIILRLLELLLSVETHQQLPSLIE